MTKTKMTIKDLVVTKEEERRIKAKPPVIGKCRYCKGEVKDNKEMIQIPGVARGNPYSHRYCAIREIKRLKSGLITNNPLMEIVKF